ncbi:hypothetical protein NX059_009800 [Plenodomus lindquistii]|nr:hypothetical protein NX059_009800 [Plenodomus lindquistii]
MPSSWFFAIHEDTPEQDAANHMEHSASVLDISSDDDVETKKLNEDLERGKENIPPPEWVVAQQARLQSQASMSTSIAGSDQVEPEAQEPTKRRRMRELVQDAMEEDRRPLGDLPPCEFYGEGCDASTYVTVDAGIEKPSGLSKECDFSIAADEDVVEEAPVVEEAAPAVEKEQVIATEDAVVSTPSETVVCVESPVVAATPSQEADAPIDGTTSHPQESPAIAS